MSAAETILNIRGLRTWFYSRERQVFVRSVDGVDLELVAGHSLGIVGESGSGKSATLLSALGLISGAPGVIAGEVWFGGGEAVNLLEGLDRCVSVTEAPDGSVCVDKDLYRWERTVQHRLRPYLGRGISVIFQNPRAALNPLMTVGKQVSEVIALRHPGLSKTELRQQSIHWLTKVRLDTPERRCDDYPHMLSGGQCQRVMIAMALAAEPKLLVADEPTTGLDAAISEGIVELLQEIRTEFGTAIITISHDISLIARLADEVVVMYGGRVLESGPAATVLGGGDRHPYTEALLASVPGQAVTDANGHLPAIGGEVPDPAQLITGCRFQERCALGRKSGHRGCVTEEPALQEIDGGHFLRCWLREREAG